MLERWTSATRTATAATASSTRTATACCATGAAGGSRTWGCTRGRATASPLSPTAMPWPGPQPRAGGERDARGDHRQRAERLRRQEGVRRGAGPGRRVRSPTGARPCRLPGWRPAGPGRARVGAGPWSCAGGAALGSARSPARPGGGSAPGRAPAGPRGPQIVVLDCAAGPVGRRLRLFGTSTGSSRGDEPAQAWSFQHGCTTGDMSLSMYA